MDAVLTAVVGAPIRTQRRATYLQGATVNLDHRWEFRAHAWFALPQGHDLHPTADRGMAWMLRPVNRDGLYGPLQAGIAWLAMPLPRGRCGPASDWVAQMIHDQGYLELPGTETEVALADPSGQAVLACLLAEHLGRMVNHRILEERLGGAH